MSSKKQHYGIINATEHFNIHAGPYIGLLASSQIKDMSTNGNTYIEDIDRDSFNTLDYGLAGGLCFDFEGGTLGIRYNYGLNEIGKSATKLGDITKDSNNSVLQFYLGFNF